MKIWIISSDPFLKDFAKIAKAWNEKHKAHVVTSSVTKYSFGPSGSLELLRQYLQIKPDLIVTDHGHPAFIAIDVINKITRKNTKITLLLRGNYWLEAEEYV